MLPRFEAHDAYENPGVVRRCFRESEAGYERDCATTPRIGMAGVTAEELRARTFTELESLGFRPASSLPLPVVDRPIRPAAEVAARLIALGALLGWVAFPERAISTDRLKNYIDRNGLRGWLTDEEAGMIDLSRSEANRAYVDNIGWKLENMWALAWVLGFEPAPDLKASQVREEVTRPLLFEFLPGLDATIEGLLAVSVPRSASDVIVMEYRFYCAHNAVRSAQLGGDTLPEGFHPIMHGGAVHERRHALSWCVQPGVAWDETDLST